MTVILIVAIALIVVLAINRHAKQNPASPQPSKPISMHSHDDGDGEEPEYREYHSYTIDEETGEKREKTFRVYEWEKKERWEDYPAPDYDAVHTYCKVAFDDSGRTFYYRTRNPELKVGDMVYVPVGYKYEKKIGKIVSMKDYVGRMAPYPLEKTKHIIGKVSDGEV